MKKKYKLNSLIGLYISYIFQKGTIIIFGVSLLLMLIFLIIVANPWLENYQYLLSSKDIHRGYFEQAIFIIQVFNSVILATIVIQIAINSASFDSLFVSYISRKNIAIAKIFSLLIVLSLLILFEVLLLYMIPIFRYSLYKPEINDLIVLFYLSLSIIFELMLSMFLTTLTQAIFMPMALLFVSIILKAISSIAKLRDILSYFIPMIYIEDMNAKLDIKTIVITCILSLAFSLLYFNLYSYKDLKW
ncbi:MAG: hypothetical protein IKP77_07365 [Acholeplasmatales bacterium]|nr:hypothetical protein [Acholeplasmatales bacterium]